MMVAVVDVMVILSAHRLVTARSVPASTRESCRRAGDADGDGRVWKRKCDVESMHWAQR